MKDGEEEEIPIAEMITRNVTGFSDVADFEYIIQSDEVQMTENKKIPAFQKEGTIKAHYRVQNIWQLVGRVIRDALGPPTRS